MACSAAAPCVAILTVVEAAFGTGRARYQTFARRFFAEIVFSAERRLLLALGDQRRPLVEESLRAMMIELLDSTAHASLPAAYYPLHRATKIVLWEGLVGHFGFSTLLRRDPATCLAPQVRLKGVGFRVGRPDHCARFSHSLVWASIRAVACSHHPFFHGYYQTLLLYLDALEDGLKQPEEENVVPAVLDHQSGVALTSPPPRLSASHPAEAGRFIEALLCQRRQARELAVWLVNTDPDKVEYFLYFSISPPS